MTNTQVLLIEATPGAPIACDMTGAHDSAQERFAEYGRLYAHALVDHQRTGDAVVFTFAAKPGVTDWVADLARREAACCPFSTYEVTANAELVVWRTSSRAGAAAQAILDEYCALPDQIDGGLDAMFKRLADRGIFIASSAPGRFAIDERKAAPGLLGRIKAACGC